MNFRGLKIFLFFPFLLFSSSTVYATSLIVPEVYQLIKVNGKKTTSNFFSSKTKVELKTGRNVIVLRYSELFEDDDNDDHATIKSDPQIILFTLVDKNVNEYFLIPPDISDDSQARIYAGSPKVVIEFNDESSGKRNTLSLLSQSLSEFESDAAFQQMEKAITQSILPSKPKSIQLEKLEKSDAFEKLKYWWKQADAEQKKQFIEFSKQ